MKNEKTPRTMREAGFDWSNPPDIPWWVWCLVWVIAAYVIVTVR